MTQWILSMNPIKPVLAEVEVTLPQLNMHANTQAIDRENFIARWMLRHFKNEDKCMAWNLWCCVHLIKMQYEPVHKPWRTVQNEWFETYCQDLEITFSFFGRPNQYTLWNGELYSNLKMQTDLISRNISKFPPMEQSHVIRPSVV